MATSEKAFETRTASMSGAANGSTTERFQDDMKNLRQDIGSLAESVRRLAGAKVETSMEDAQAKLGEVEAAIRRSPGQSAMIAAGIGFIVGLILSR